MAKKRYVERALFDLAPALRQTLLRPTKRALEKQKQKEEALKRDCERPFEPVFRFVVASDLHISASDARPAERLKELFLSAYRYADEHPTYRALDAVVFTGDNVTSGTDAEYEILKQILRASKRDDTALIAVMGNHEYHDTGHEGFVRHMEQPLDKHVVLKGFHFIGLSTDPKDTWHTVKQVRWMRKELKKAAADSGKKPIFTMQHGHIFKTVYVSRSWYTQMSALLHFVYARYPQVINFSGHSHGPVNHPLTVWQKKYTLFGAGTLAFFEMERDISDNTVPPRADEAAGYLMVEVDKDDNVRVKPYNILTGAFYRSPRTDSKTNEELVYQINTPSDRTAFVYTKRRSWTDPAPQFDSDAVVSVSAQTQDSLTVSFPQAKSSTCVYGYRVEAVPAARPNRGRVKREIYSGFQNEPLSDVVVCTLSGLMPGTAYKIRVTPLNAWRTSGTPIEGNAFIES